jgi:hypothetical protein
MTRSHFFSVQIDLEIVVDTDLPALMQTIVEAISRAC